MEALGFAKIRIWYQHMNFNFKDSHEYCDQICQTLSAKNVLSKQTPEMAEKLRQEIREEYERKMSEDLDPKSFEVMIITAVKA